MWGAPWGCGIEPHGNPAFHVATTGACSLQVDGGTEHIALSSGDLVVLLHGPRHWVRDHPGTPAPDFEELLARGPRDTDPAAVRGGPGPRTGLLCGGFILDGNAAPTILGALPPVVQIRGARGRPAPWVAATLALVRRQSASAAPGAEVVVSRLADALLIQALRCALTDLGEDDARRRLRLRAARSPAVTIG